MFLPRVTLYTSLLVVLPTGSVLPQAPSREATRPDSTMAIVFAGGTLQKLVEIVSKQWKTANIVIDRKDSVDLPAAPFKWATLEQALTWVRHTSEARKHNLILEIEPARRGGADVFIFTTPAPITPRYEVKTYSLEAFADKKSEITPEAVTQAVKDALGKQRPKWDGSADYRSETRQLTVSGRRDDIAVADQAVDEITQGRRMAGTLTRLEGRIRALETSLEEMKKAATKTAVKQTR